MEEERQARLQMGNAGVFPGGLMERKGGAVERSLHSVHVRRWEKCSILFTVKKAAVDKKTWVVHQKQRKITGLISPEHARGDGAALQVWTENRDVMRTYRSLLLLNMKWSRKSDHLLEKEEGVAEGGWVSGHGAPEGGLPRVPEEQCRHRDLTKCKTCQKLTSLARCELL